MNQVHGEAVKGRVVLYESNINLLVEQLLQDFLQEFIWDRDFNPEL